MIRMKYRFFSVIYTAVAASLLACEHPPAGYRITGEVTGFPDSTMMYLQNTNTQENIDSAYVIAGHFEMNGTLEHTPEQLWLHTRVDNSYTYLLIGNDEIQVRGDITDFPWYVQVSGSKIHDEWTLFREATVQYDVARDSLVQRYFLLPPDAKEEVKTIWDTIRRIDSVTQSLRTDLVKTNINTYAGLIELGYLKRSLPFDTVGALYGRLSPDLQASKYGKVIATFLEGVIPEIGDNFLDFEAFDASGKSTRFSALAKGRYVLLDFTAAYCGPCIEAAPELREISEQFSDSLSVVSFSVDEKKDIWLNSLKRDSVSWMSLWDGKGTFSDTYIQYGISGFPTFLLINPEGRITAKWSGYGKGGIIDKLKHMDM